MTITVSRDEGRNAARDQVAASDRAAGPAGPEPSSPAPRDQQAPVPFGPEAPNAGGWIALAPTDAIAPEGTAGPLDLLETSSLPVQAAPETLAGPGEAAPGFVVPVASRAVAARPAPEPTAPAGAPGGESGTIPAPREADLIDEITALERESLETALFRMLDGIGLGDVSEGRPNDVAALVALLAGIVAIEVVRRRWRRRSDPDHARVAPGPALHVYR